MNPIAFVVEPITNLANNIIDKFVADKDAKLAYKKQLEELEYRAQNDAIRLQNARESRDAGGILSAIEAQRAVITAEAQSDHWLAAIWRPTLMGIFVAIIGNNYLLAPYADALFNVHLAIPLPPEAWDTIQIGLGGYIGGRSLEKIAKIMRRKA